MAKAGLFMMGLGIGGLIFRMPVAVKTGLGLDFVSLFGPSVGECMIRIVSADFRLDGVSSVRDAKDRVWVREGTGVIGLSEEKDAECWASCRFSKLLPSL